MIVHPYVISKVKSFILNTDPRFNTEELMTVLFIAYAHSTGNEHYLNCSNTFAKNVQFVYNNFGHFKDWLE